MSMLEVEQHSVPEELVNQLVKGYDALSVEIKLLDEQRRQLENRLSWAKQQVRRYFFHIVLLMHTQTLTMMINL